MYQPLECSHRAENIFVLHRFMANFLHSCLRYIELRGVYVSLAFVYLLRRELGFGGGDVLRESSGKRRIR